MGDLGAADEDELKSGKTKADTFAVHKALSKAQRNAFEALIPLELVEYLKAQFLGDDRAVKVIPGAGSAVEIERPPPLDDEEAEQLLAEIRATYDEIKEIDRLVMPPGQFNAIVMGSQHSHDRLRESLAHLQTFLRGEQDLAARREEFRKLVSKDAFEREVQKMRGLSQERRLGRLAELVEQAEKGSGIVRYRIEDEKATGRKARKVAVLTVTASELDELIDALGDDVELDGMRAELSAASLELLRREREASRK